jgi:capsular polysaccharide biosynthesis protein
LGLLLDPAAVQPFCLLHKYLSSDVKSYVNYTVGDVRITTEQNAAIADKTSPKLQRERAIRFCIIVFCQASTAFLGACARMTE